MTHSQDIVDNALKYFAKALRDEAVAIRKDIGMSNAPTRADRFVPTCSYDLPRIHLLHFDGHVPYQALYKQDSGLACLLIDSLEDGANRLEAAVGVAVDMSNSVTLLLAVLRKQSVPKVQE